MDYKASNKIKDVEMCHLISLSFKPFEYFNLMCRQDSRLDVLFEGET